MSRVGKKPIPLPEGVQVQLEGNLVCVKGPKGELSQEIHQDMTVELADQSGGRELQVTRPSDNRRHRSLHGLTRTLVANMVEGVTKGFEKVLVIHGTGYRAALSGANLVLSVGYSHPVEISPPKGITVEVPAPTRIVVKGIDKQLVGQTAAHIRAVKEPEPYHGYGIRYEGEHVRRKEGKTAT